MVAMFLIVSESTRSPLVLCFTLFQYVSFCFTYFSQYLVVCHQVRSAPALIDGNLRLKAQLMLRGVAQ